MSKFDGKNWTTYNRESGLINDFVNDISFDNEGNVWFSTRGGASLLRDELATNVSEKEKSPYIFNLNNNYPNPFNPTTTIEYQLKSAGKVIVSIYNTIGQLISMLVNENQTPGFYSVVWDGRNNEGAVVPSGVYFYYLVSGNFSQTKKMLYLK